MTTLLTASAIVGCGSAKAEESGEDVSAAENVAAESTASETTAEESIATETADDDDNLFMQVKSFDETSFTGDLCREERISQEDVNGAVVGSDIYSTNGTQFTTVTFEDVNKELEYDTDEVFKNDVVGTKRFDGFLVKNADDNFYYALEKEDYESEYRVVSMFTEGLLQKPVEENVTLKINENADIYLQKMVEKDGASSMENEYIIGKDFKGNNYPGWSEGATEYYLTDNMLMAISVKDGELYKAVQIFVP
jgi:hypothetical protein